MAPVAIALAQVAGGSPSLSIALEPAELGRVEVRIERRGAEGDAIRILAERPETLALLQRDRHELGRALDQAGVPRAAEGGLSFGLAAGQEQPPGGGHGAAGGRRGGGAPGRSAAAEAIAHPLPTPPRGAGRALLDITA